MSELIDEALEKATKDIEFYDGGYPDKNRELVGSFKRERGFRSGTASYKHKDGTAVVISKCGAEEYNDRGAGLDIAIIKNEQYLRISTYSKDSTITVSMNEFGRDKKQEISFPLVNKNGIYSIKNIAASLSSMPQLQETLNKYVPAEYNDIRTVADMREVEREIKQESKNNAAFMNAFNNFSKGGR